MEMNLTIQHNSLVPVYKTDKGTQTVSLRDIHAKLDTGKDFSTWAKAKCKEHRLKENEDFVKLSAINPSEGGIKKRGRKRVEYILPLRLAKKIAMGVNTEAAEVIKDYFLACEEIAIAAQQAVAAPRPLVAFTDQKVQVQCVKEVGKALYGPNNDPNQIIKHHREVTKLLTGFRPSAYVRSFVKRGLRVASFSARQLMRRMDPAKAATAAFMDDACMRGKTLAQLTEAGIVEALPQAFNAMLRAGFTPAEIEAMAA